VSSIGVKVDLCDACSRPIQHTKPLSLGRHVGRQGTPDDEGDLGAQVERAAGQVPGADKRYSTRQLLDSVFGDAAGQRLRKTAAEARYWELKGAVLAGESLPRDLLTPALEQIFVVIRQLITGSSMTTVEKRDLCNTIATWPIAVRTVATKAAKQTKFAGVEETNGDGANGEAGEAEAEEAP
jgi:hypothetical protein